MGKSNSEHATLQTRARTTAYHFRHHIATTATTTTAVSLHWKQCVVIC